jgi:hypothetical protein
MQNAGDKVVDVTGWRSPSRAARCPPGAPVLRLHGVLRSRPGVAGEITRAWERSPRPIPVSRQRSELAQFFWFSVKLARCVPDRPRAGGSLSWPSGVAGSRVRYFCWAGAICGPTPNRAPARAAGHTGCRSLSASMATPSSSASLVRLDPHQEVLLIEATIGSWAIRCADAIDTRGLCADLLGFVGAAQVHSSPLEPTFVDGPVWS